MEHWFVVGALVAMAMLLAWRDPRRLSIGVLLLAAASLATMDSLVAVLDHYSDPVDHQTDGYILLGVIMAVLLTSLLLAAYLIINGVAMVRREGRRLAHLLSLLLGLGMVGYVVLALVAIGLQWPYLAVASVLVGLPLLYLAFVFAAFVLYGWLYGWLVPRLAPPVNAVVVLGAGLRGDRVTPLLASRLRRGQEVLAQAESAGRSAVMVPSGGQGPGETVSEAAAMAAWLEAEGTPASVILPEDRSRTTDENIARSQALLRERGIAGPYAVVTNNYHAFRAAMLMRRHGMPGQAQGAPTAGYFVPSATIREFLAVLRDHRWINLALVTASSFPLFGWVMAILVLGRPV